VLRFIFSHSYTIMQFYLAGQWQSRAESIAIHHPFDQQFVDTVPVATAADIETALHAAEQGAQQMRQLTAHQRYTILHKAAQLLRQTQTDFARTITLESGKVQHEAQAEVSRAAETLEWSAEAAKRLRGETLPLDAVAHGQGKFGFTLRVPCGVVVAITPFNFPLNLPCHKVGPALAAGNSVILKPASATPLTALKLTELLLQAGLPELGIQCLTGHGSRLGTQLVADSRVRKVSFTGSRDVGEQITRAAGLKRITMELGSNAPVVVLDDADIELAARAIASTGYANAGQVCISAQRIFATPRSYGNLLDALVPLVRAIPTGDPQQTTTKLGPLIQEREATRVSNWIQEAVGAGAKLLCGGQQDRAIVQATVLTDVPLEQRLMREELFGPAVGCYPCASVEEAIALANQTNYGLSASIFTQNLDHALRFAQQAESGNIHINWGPQWRADFMPYGGLKESGFGKEGPEYAVQEMTELKMVVIH
jgi:acyl-CoA reductase-like NAD-dependent aldehyde dehydrogenase